MAYLLCYLSPFIQSLHFLTKDASKDFFRVSLCVQNFGGLLLLSTFLLQPHIEQQFERIQYSRFLFFFSSIPFSSQYSSGIADEKSDIKSDSKSVVGLLL